MDVFCFAIANGASLFPIGSMYKGILTKPFPLVHVAIFHLMSLDIQTPGEERCLNLQISPEVRLLGVPFTPILTRYDRRILDV